MEKAAVTVTMVTRRLSVVVTDILSLSLICDCVFLLFFLSIAFFSCLPLLTTLVLLFLLASALVVFVPIPLIFLIITLPSILKKTTNILPFR